MKKIDRQTLATIMATMGVFSMGVDDLSAMEGKKQYQSMAYYFKKSQKQNKLPWKSVRDFLESDLKNPESIPTISELQTLLNDPAIKNQILTIPMNLLGQNAREEQADKSTELIRLWAQKDETNLKKKFGITLKDINIWREVCNCNPEYDPSGGLLTQVFGGHDDSIDFIGRGRLHDDTTHTANEIYQSSSTILEAELRRLSTGEINCTSLAEIVRWWLNRNGFWARTYQLPNHVVCITEARNAEKTSIFPVVVEVNEPSKIRRTFTLEVTPLHQYLQNYKLPTKYPSTVIPLSPRSKTQEFEICNAQGPGSCNAAGILIDKILDVQYCNEKYPKRLTALLNGLKDIVPDLMGEDIGEWDLSMAPRNDWNKIIIPLNLFNLTVADNDCKKFKSVDDPAKSEAFEYAVFELPKNWDTVYSKSQLKVSKIDKANSKVRAIITQPTYTKKKKSCFITGKYYSESERPGVSYKNKGRNDMCTII